MSKLVCTLNLLNLIICLPDINDGQIAYICPFIKKIGGLIPLQLRDGFRFLPCNQVGIFRIRLFDVFQLPEPVGFDARIQIIAALQVDVAVSLRIFEFGDRQVKIILEQYAKQEQFDVYLGKSNQIPVGNPRQKIV